jgi:formate dehydrogenase subunit gamma
VRSRPASIETGRPSGRLLRFVLAERLAHWAKAAFFIVAAAGGLLMWIPRTRQLMGARRLQFSHLHGGIGILMIVVPLAILLALDRRRFADDLREVDVWDRDDRRWFWAALRLRTIRGKDMPPQGRLNAGQKVSSVLVSLLAVGLLVTGCILLVRAHAPAWLVSRALALHMILAVGALALFVGHMGHVFLTRHGHDSLRAMLGGTMSDEIARERHEKWWREAGERSKDRPPAP